VRDRYRAGTESTVGRGRRGASRAIGYRLWHRYREVAGRCCVTVARRRTCSRARSAPRRSRRSSLLAGARHTGRCDWPGSCLTRPRRSARCCAGTAAPGFLVRRAPPRCARRYERERSGELLHVDTKKLGRFWEPGKRVLGERARRPQRNRRLGRQHPHVAIDDHSRLADAELLRGTPGQMGIAKLFGGSYAL
jgi:hypothetical protein